RHVERPRRPEPARTIDVEGTLARRGLQKLLRLLIGLLGGKRAAAAGGQRQGGQRQQQPARRAAASNHGHLLLFDRRIIRSCCAERPLARARLKGTGVDIRVTEGQPFPCQRYLWARPPLSVHSTMQPSRTSVGPMPPIGIQKPPIRRYIGGMP